MKVQIEEVNNKDIVSVALQICTSCIIQIFMRRLRNRGKGKNGGLEIVFVTLLW